MSAYLVPGEAVCAAYADLAREHNAAPIGSAERTRAWNVAEGFILALKTLYPDEACYIGHLIAATDAAIMREVSEHAPMCGGFLLDRSVAVDLAVPGTERTEVWSLRAEDIVEDTIVEWLEGLGS